MLQPFLENLTIEQAIEKKKLYIVNFEILKDLPCAYDKNKERVSEK